ncbi:MAG: N-6 DNA methylase [Candidatus Peribacteria bacterium]|nr:N-6 DNA methylase [Candidatus Peribacteria bacterium]
MVQENTLHAFEEYQLKSKEMLLNDDCEPKQFDFVVTNPPFGNKIKVLKADSKHFDLGHTRKKENDEWVKTKEVKDTEPQVLFIERCLQFLKDG